MVQREMEGDKGLVCVTGGTGFIGSWLIMRLLDRGYSVRTTVRSDSEQKKDISFLTSLPRASERLQIFNADLSDPQSFNAPIEGCTGVFHVATPVDFEDREPEEIVTKRAIDGALGVLQACLNSKTVKRVVYTSSASAVVFNGDQEVDEMDESFWSDVDFLKAPNPTGNSGSYMISKTLTERATLEFAEKHGLDVVTIIPSFVVGPFICPKFPSSVRAILAMVLGDKDQYSFLLNASLVHVDDVARAHIFLLECPTVKGRYNCSSDVVTIEQMSQFLSARYPEFQIPTLDSLKEIKGYKIPSLSTKKLLDSGFKYKYGINEMFDGAIQCCKEKGYL
ncbi:vestitone reductase-like isoform X2 [Corylus avellana]|uniref:vestitone reductase-like isoform X2 n=1 Tax=Corylus avellana TaxID=13451 RepID=UPI00286CB76D|nr:vestitone reductase-like isoform X2 [Corylus avellana]